MTSAGLQRKNENVSDLKNELLDNINKYFDKGEQDNESNTAQ